jgi:PKD repeat protein
LVANFSQNSYTITASAGATGSISPSGTLTKNCDESQVFTATPSANYTVGTWSVDGGVVQTGGANYALTNIQGAHSVSVAFAVLPSAPVIDSLTVSNALMTVGGETIVVAGEVLGFDVTAHDPGSLPLNYQWNFGDGTILPWSASHTATHIYTNTSCGSYSASVTVTNGGMVTSSNLVLAVACELGVTNKGAKVQAKLNFAKPGQDSFKMKAVAALGAVNLTNAHVLVSMGGVEIPFVLDAKGKGTGKYSIILNGKTVIAGTCKLSYNKKTALWTITVSAKFGSWQDEWLAFGLTDETVPKPGRTVTMPVVVLIGGDAFAAEKQLTYTATQNKSGTAK